MAAFRPWAPQIEGQATTIAGLRCGWCDREAPLIVWNVAACRALVVPDGWRVWAVKSNVGLDRGMRVCCPLCAGELEE